MRSKHLITFLVLLAFVLPAFPAQAGGAVSVCDEVHLRDALAGGGTVTFACSGTIILASTVSITANTTIDGSGQTVTISGGYAVQVFDVRNGITLSLNELTIANGSRLSGGGIYVYYGGILILSNSTLHDNNGGIGGGIYNDGGTVSVSNSTFYLNGGGIYIQSGTLTVSKSTFYDNFLGGIYNNGGTVTVSNSTFSNNSNSYTGGAIYNGGTLNVTNSTFSGNSANYGGGIGTNGGTLTVTNSTFSGNSANSGGGGIYNISGTVNLGNTIVANSPSGGNCSGLITNNGGNLSYPITDTTCLASILGDPRLGPLQDNGGSTFTMALGDGSPAIDAGNPALCPATDQRGVHRPIDGDKDGKAICDIGSFEYQPTYPLFLPMVRK